MEIEVKDVGGGGGLLGVGVGPVELESGLVLVGGGGGFGGGIGGGFGGLLTGLEGSGGGHGLVGAVGRGNGGIGGGGFSDDEDPSMDGDGMDGGGGGGMGFGGGGGGGKAKKSSPWQRMKWTDAMVKLLISMVLFIGEDPNGADGGVNDGCKRKPAPGGLLQKKGKWKSVSKVMMNKGCYVSPQQCEDKFNDLNKRFKRLNDILGKDAASTVVENPVLLDGMGSLSGKAKEDVRKILSSRHLFYKEMAHYHSGNKAALAGDLEFHQPSFQNALVPGVRDASESARQFRDVMDDDDEEDENEDENEACENDGEDDYEHLTLGGIRDENGGDGIGDLRELFSKRRKLSQKMEEVELGLAASALQDYGSKEISGVELVDPTELMGVLQEQDRGKRSEEDLDPQLSWMKDRTMQLEEQKVGLQAEAFNLEKQRFKWQKLSWKKDHEIERLRLGNERIKLDNERKEEAAAAGVAAADDVVIGELSDAFGKKIEKLEDVELGTITGAGFPEYSPSKEITGVDLANTTDIMGILQDSSSTSKGPQEQHQQWIRSRTIQLEEQKVCLQMEAFNLEKERFKWQKQSWKTDHEIERMRLENDRIKLENERRALQLKQKELLLQFLRNG